ncbi:hypothetical protein Kpol_1024p47 [Vanderwaltozyma polyspora DSM 70294]|uniref:VPS9 domain-containing protein n=1 Tax=Vanderwaltozyma polyspora (strain ATCC 22028 / DSM 70294 / BCRC 21397 / CBS 2163 / NBRC 10782 / NRRL Y-8283 / UCD 57-17) TaxID=436907 RepID=A7TLK7_VANPO|nr:uncharacterized protein Kpol_1024p47 [Vanderwaltozyma polyspora DSM 70294]EDO16893.1 hypothetical protein Kpol_1024p47 [Vanderwaltozyma polyspora DSM 70294]
MMKDGISMDQGLKRGFFTPPITNPKFDSTQSISESYKSTDQTLEVSSQTSDSSNINPDSLVTQEDVEREINCLRELPLELSKLIDLFIADLKQPKYIKPLTINQLSSIFQGFYVKFDKSCFQYLSQLNATTNSNSTTTTFLTARETLSSGLSGIFARSRSSSGSSIMRVRRSSSLFSNDSATVTPMLTPDEINKQLKNNELMNLKIEKYMEFCEREVFKRILEVGISVPTQNFDVNKHKKSHSDKETFRVTNLFRNSPEYGKYNKLLDEKFQCLLKLETQQEIDFKKFLDVPESFKDEDLPAAKEILEDLVSHTISPCEKSNLLLKLHESMIYSQNMSNDEFLSLLIYYLIRITPQNIFLTIQFIRLFRYKKKLVQNELYVLTNIEAALVFIEDLTLSDFPEDIQGKLTDNEIKILEHSISSKVDIPQLSSIYNNQNDTIHEHNLELPLANEGNNISSYDGIRSVFDASLRNIIGKFRPSSPPTANVSREYNLPPAVSKKVDDESGNSTIILKTPPPPIPFDNSWNKYKDYKFEDLKISEMREIFEIYQKIVEERAV